MLRYSVYNDISSISNRFLESLDLIQSALPFLRHTIRSLMSWNKESSGFFLLYFLVSSLKNDEFLFVSFILLLGQGIFLNFFFLSFFWAWTRKRWRGVTDRARSRSLFWGPGPREEWWEGNGHCRVWGDPGRSSEIRSIVQGWPERNLDIRRLKLIDHDLIINHYHRLLVGCYFGHWDSCSVFVRYCRLMIL